MRLLVRAVQFAQDSLDDADVQRAAETFFVRRIASTDELARLLVDDDADVQFFPWLLWDCDMPGGPLGKRLPMKGRPASEREVHQALLACPPSIWRMDAIDGALATLTCLADGTRAEVVEPMLQGGPPSGEVLVARVLNLGDVALLDAVHAALPMRCAPSLSAAAQLAMADPRPSQLRRLLKAAARAALELRPTLPKALAQAGLRTTLVLRHGGEAATLELCRRAVADGLLEALGPRRFAFTAAGAAPRGAVLRLHRERVHASTIRPERLQDLQQAICEILPQATLTMTMHRDLTPLFNRRGRAQPKSPEVRALANDWMCEALAGFTDTPLDLLDGQTPRQAALSERGRVRVGAWLRDVQTLAELADSRYQLQFAELRRDLGGV